MFEIKSNEDKTNISIPMFSGSGKKVISFGSMATRTSPKSTCGGFAAYYSTIGSGGYKFRSSKGGNEFEAFPKS